MIKPKILKRGDTIGVIAPSSPLGCNEIELSKKALCDLGFKVKMGKSCFERYGYLAGSDKLRAEDLNSMFNDSKVDGIICLRGGYGAVRILNLIDYNCIKENPKVFVGYSDITAIHIAIHKNCDMVTFHGPMAVNMVDIDEFSKGYFERAMMNSSPMGIISNPDNDEIKCLVKGVCEGEIVGGNLSLIASTIGTPYEIDTRDKILFIEEIDEEPYRVDRMLNQLLLSGKLNGAKGIIIGDFKNCDAKNSDKSLSLKQVFEDIIVPLNKPTIMNLRAGHCNKKICLPLGIHSMLNADTCELNILENSVIK